MEVPTWAYEEVLRIAKPAAVQLALALYRYGSPQVSGSGTRRAYWRGSKNQLAVLCGVSKRSLDVAIVELLEAGLIVEHEVKRTNAGVAYSALFDREGGANFAPPCEPENRIHDDVKETPIDLKRSGLTTMMPAADSEGGANFASLLKEAGVLDPGRWAQWPQRDVVAAIEMAKRRPGVRSVGAVARTALRNGFTASNDVEEAEPAPDGRSWMAQAAAAHEARIAASPWAQRQHLRETPDALGDTDGDYVPLNTPRRGT